MKIKQKWHKEQLISYVYMIVCFFAISRGSISIQYNFALYDGVGILHTIMTYIILSAVM